MSKLYAKLVNKETIRYIIFGVLTTIIGLGSYAAAVHLSFSTLVSNIVSTVLAVAFAFVTNKIFVFESKGWGPRLLFFEIAKFCGARAFIFFSETVLLIIFVDVLGFHSVLMKCFTMVLVVVGNYVLSKVVVFRRGN